MVKYSYYPGNVARQSSFEVEDTIQPLCKTLGIELFEIVGYNSDGGNIIKQGNKDLQLTLNARNIALAEKKRMAITLSLHVLLHKAFFMRHWKLSETIQSPLQTLTRFYPKLAELLPKLTRLQQITCCMY